MAIDVVLRLDDIGLFKNPRGRESKSQYQRACEIRDQFADCMRNALCGNGCVMPDLCATGASSLACAHLSVDYANFTGTGIPLTKRSAALIDQRLRAIGTLVYRGGEVSSAHPLGTYAGDEYIAALSRISSFPGRRTGGSGSTAKKVKRSRLPTSSTRRAAARGNRGFFSRLFG
jgi:hypothetical protein